MADLEEVRNALDVLLACGSSKSDVTILHCTTDYPAAMGDVNLQAMVTMRDAFGVEVGYSDHTLGYEVAVAAVALGAVVIEKHSHARQGICRPRSCGKPRARRIRQHGSCDSQH